MNKNAMIGRVVAFRGDNESYEDDAAAVELTGVSADGTIEITFDLGRERVYVSVRAGDLMARVAAFGREA